jgi:hypothetical protein
MACPVGSLNAHGLHACTVFGSHLMEITAKQPNQKEFLVI